jgi:hypothetical protein
MITTRVSSSARAFEGGRKRREEKKERREKNILI